MTIEEIASEIRAGKWILVRCFDQRDRKHQVRLLCKAGDFKFSETSWRVADVSGGFAHFAITDHEVMGMEYHDADGPLTETMRSRVRL